jgi:hypothetical protein
MAVALRRALKVCPLFPAAKWRAVVANRELWYQSVMVPVHAVVQVKRRRAVDPETAA